MSRHIPVAGQRYISQSEPELGLGRVTDYDGRLLCLEFPAVAEQRTYQFREAPVSRIEFQPGDQIRGSHDPDWAHHQWVVTRVEQHGENLVYTLDCEIPGSSITVSESELPSDIRFGSPDQRFSSGQIDRLGSFDSFVETLTVDASLRASVTAGLGGCRTELLPHQLYIAEKVCNRLSPRVLLADQVGLGKTIEAGIILHKLLITGQASRVLLLVPDSLVHQWLVEMLRRFNLTFSLFDVDRFMSLIESEGNPFESEQLIICSMDLLSMDEVMLAAISQAQWDMVVVDEAHHLAWSAHGVNQAYHCVEQLALKTNGVLLLTATPEAGGLDGQFGLLRLLDPDRFHDLDSYHSDQARYKRVNDCITELMDSPASDLAPVIATINDSLSLTDGLALDSDLGREDLIQQLLDRHGTGRVLFRNTRKAVGGFPDRKLISEHMSLPDEYRRLRDDDPILYPERIWTVSQQTGEEDLALSTQWCHFDPRSARLIELMAEPDIGKVLLICHHAETAVELAKFCRDKGIRCAAFHEHLTIIERDRAAAYFSDMDEGAQLLICSEIGSEGRNFQFAHHLVMFDLPPDPDLVEQRIGRLDRIGQKQDIRIHIWPLVNSAQMVLFDWMNQGLDLFTRSLSGAWSIYHRHADELDWLMRNVDEHARTHQLYKQTREDVVQMLAMQQQGRDRLIELNSCREDEANDIIDRIIEAEQGEGNGNALQAYLHRLLDELGIEHEFHSDQTDVIREGEHMRIDHVPGLGEDGMTVTWSREKALRREDIGFMSWEHPLLRSLMSHVIDGGIGSSTLGMIKNSTLMPQGTVLFELIHQLDVMAPVALRLGRFLPMKPVRLLFSHNGEELSQQLSGDQLTRLARKVPAAIRQPAIKQLKPVLEQIMTRASKRLAAQAEPQRNLARDAIERELGSELDRLRQLKAINPGVRQSEIDALKHRHDNTLQLAGQAEYQLRAIRVLIFS